MQLQRPNQQPPLSGGAPTNKVIEMTRIVELWTMQGQYWIRYGGQIVNVDADYNPTYFETDAREIVYGRLFLSELSLADPMPWEDFESGYVYDADGHLQATDRARYIREAAVEVPEVTDHA